MKKEIFILLASLLTSTTFAKDKVSTDYKPNNYNLFSLPSINIKCSKKNN